MSTPGIEGKKLGKNEKGGQISAASQVAKRWIDLEKQCRNRLREEEEVQSESK